jgi:hypothetical protein
MAREVKADEDVGVPRGLALRLQQANTEKNEETGFEKLVALGILPA